MTEEQLDAMRRIRSHTREVDEMFFRALIDGKISSNNVREIHQRLMDCVNTIPGLV